jgi:uncharacterized damage-inducible protein DinB
MPNDVRYPVGPFTLNSDVSAERRRADIDHLARLSDELRAAVNGLNDEQLDTPYRDGGWTVRQVVHHLVDSHVNAYVRMKLALTEDNPEIKAYDEKAWSESEDARNGPADFSMTLIAALHERWVWWLRTLADDDLSRTLRHPELGEVSVDFLLQLYAWHGRHHVAHITGLAARKAW